MSQDEKATKQAITRLAELEAMFAIGLRQCHEIRTNLERVYAPAQKGCEKVSVLSDEAKAQLLARRNRNIKYIHP